MKLYPTLFIALFIICHSLSGALAQKAANPCSCSQSLEELIANVSQNYPGFADKVIPSTRAEYDKLTERLRLQANTTTQEDCLILAKEWIDFFRDHHLSVSAASAGPSIELEGKSPEFIRQHFAGTEKLPIPETAFKEYLQKNTANLDPIEGIWETPTRSYRVAVLRNQTNKRDFAAVILKADSVYWMPGQVKLELKKRNDKEYLVVLYLRDHSRDVYITKFEKPSILQLGNFAWHKVYPEQHTNFAESTDKRPVPPLPGISFKRLSDSTVLLRISSFNGALFQQTDSIIRANRSIFLSTPNLIVDIRDNGGGSTSNYRELMPLLYTNPIIRYTMNIFVTDENQKCYEALANNTAIRPETREWAAEILNRIKHVPRGNYVSKGQIPVDTLRFSEVTPYPKRVGVIMNRGCASSAENFVYDVKFSKKVTLYGENTGGVFDYGEIYTRNLSCGSFSLQSPTTAQQKFITRIDNIGFAPHVRLDATVGDWVEFVRVSLEKQ